MTSVYAADKRLAEPLTVPRPNNIHPAATAPPPAAESGFRKMLAAASTRGKVIPHG
ncbi:hypothetical protein [Kitasatospora sp. NPDC090091]|uniref:hypothetical protein n=1 Tax=Kitasatospora sp. NPDC090091 TaxID=3364081 RepID=UPI0038154D72